MEKSDPRKTTRRSAAMVVPDPLIDHDIPPKPVLKRETVSDYLSDCGEIDKANLACVGNGQFPETQDPLYYPRTPETQEEIIDVVGDDDEHKDSEMKQIAEVKHKDDNSKGKKRARATTTVPFGDDDLHPSIRTSPPDVFRIRRSLTDMFLMRLRNEESVSTLFQKPWGERDTRQVFELRESLRALLGPYQSDRIPQLLRPAAHMSTVFRDSPQLPKFGTATKEEVKEAFERRRVFGNTSNLYAGARCSLACLKALVALGNLGTSSASADAPLVSEALSQVMEALGFASTVLVIP